MEMNFKNRTIFKIIKKENVAPLNITPLKKKTNDSVFSKPTKATTKDNSQIKINNAKDKNSLLRFIQNNNPEILENFEILDYINSGSAGTFYEGNYKKANKQKIGMKFYLNRKTNQKNEKSLRGGKNWFKW